MKISLVKAICRWHECERGLTAIELAVVVSILAILAGLVANNVTGMTYGARGGVQSTDVAEVQKAVDGFVGQNPDAKFPALTAVVACADAVAVTSTDPLTRTTITGLATLASGECVQLDVSASFTTPDSPSTSKKFVPDYMHRNPKHLSDSAAALNGNSWVIDSAGTVANALPKEQY